MEWLTIKEMSEALGLKPVTTKARLRKLGIKSIKQIGMVGFYLPETLEQIRDANPKGFQPGNQCAARKKE